MAATQQTRPAFVIGAGPGIGTAVARQFASLGMPVGLIARTDATLDQARARLAADGRSDVLCVRADAASQASLETGLDVLAGQLGVPQVVIYNAAILRADRITELDQAARGAGHAVNVLGAITTTNHLAPSMIDAGGGTIIVTGGMPRPNAYVASLSIDKAALRAAVLLLADEYGDAGLHVVTVTVGGQVAPGTRYDPDQIAARYLELHQQPRAQWRDQVGYEGPND